MVVDLWCERKAKKTFGAAFFAGSLNLRGNIQRTNQARKLFKNY
jgi:hypothetical protein